jgi:hypothetical protein
MRLAWRAPTLPDAQLIVDLLMADGIEARMFNQNAQSAAGEIPPAVAWPQVWVMDDADLARARELIGILMAQPAPVDRDCPYCGEPNPSNFLSCWSCGRALGAI